MGLKQLFLNGERVKLSNYFAAGGDKTKKINELLVLPKEQKIWQKMERLGVNLKTRTGGKKGGESLIFLLSFSLVYFISPELKEEGDTF